MEHKLLITHVDLDAQGVYLLSKYYNIEFDAIMFQDYSNYDTGNFPYEDLTKYTTIWYFDFSPDSRSRDIIQKNNITCIIGDHHIAVEKEINEWEYDKKTYIFDNERSGTKIYYDFIKQVYNFESKSVVEEFVTLIDTYDLWKQDSELWTKASNLNRLFYKVADYTKPEEKKYHIFSDLIEHKLNYSDTFEFNSIEQRKINEDIKKEDSIFCEYITGKKKIKTRQDEAGRYFSIIQINSKISAVCNRILLKYKKLDYIIALNSYNGNNRVSIRSKKHINLLEYENVKGHENAAGYENVTEDFFEGLWTGKVYSLTLKKNTDILAE